MKILLKTINKLLKILLSFLWNNFFIPIFNFYKILFPFLWNKFLLLSTKTKIIVIILMLLFSLVASFNDENNSVRIAEDTTTTTTTTTLAPITTTSFPTSDNIYEPNENENASDVSKKPSQCEVWESETLSNQKFMQLYLEDFDEANQNYKNNDINSGEFKVILDNLYAKTLDLYFKQENLKPNSSNKESNNFYIDSFAGFASAFNLYSLYLDKGDPQYKIDSDYELELAIENSKNAVLYKSSC